MDEKSRSDPFGPDSSPLEDVLRRLEDHLLSGDGYEILKGEDDGAKPSETEGLLAGTVVDDFELVSLLGEGGMGQVWEARQLSIGRSVALKLLHPHIQFTEKGVARFQREATAGGRLTHKGIVQVYAIGVADGRNYMAQELVSGGRTLSDFLAEFRGKRELPSDYHQKIAALFAAIADALTHAHENGVIHRDIKPSNILIGEDGEPKIADFGLALVEDQLGLSRTGDHVGTPFYMSPEQAASERETIDHRTDIFSLGATLYEFLTLTRPFNGDTGQQVMHQILLVDPPDPRKLRSRVPRDLSIICLKALEKAATHRYSTMQELSADLKRHLLDQTIHAKPPGPGQRTRKWARRNPTKSVAAVVALVALVAISAMWSRAEDAREQTGQALSLADELLLQTSSGNSLPRSEAMPILAEAARFSREEGGDAPLPAAARLRSVGRMYERLGEYEEAVECLRDALAFTAEGGGSGDDLRQLKLELVNAHELAWDLKKARPLLYELLEESPRPIRDLIGAEALGRLLLVERRLDEKEGKEALEAEHGDIKALLTEVSESLGPEQVRARLHLELLALRVSSHGVEPEDLEVLQDQIEREFGPDHEMALWSLIVRRYFFIREDRREDAKEMAEEQLRRAERSRPAGNYFSGSANWGIGECIFHLGLTEDAAKHALVYYNKALEVFEDKLGSENYRVMVLRSGRAVIAMNAGQADIAESDFRLILSIREEQMGKNHMHTCFTLRALAESIERQGRYEESWELLDEAASRARVADRLFDPENLTRVSYQLGMLLHGRRLERAAATVLEFDGLEEFAGDEERRTALYTYMVRGLERYFSGANEEAAELLGRAVALAGEEERVMERALYAYFNEGDTDLMDLLFEEGEEGGNAFTSMVFHCVLGEACVRSGNLEGARGHLERVRLGALGSWSREGKLIEAWPSALEERIKSAETK